MTLKNFSMTLYENCGFCVELLLWLQSPPFYFWIPDSLHCLENFKKYMSWETAELATMSEEALRQEVLENRRTIEQLRAESGSTAEETTILVACLNEAMRAMNHSLSPPSFDGLNQPLKQYITELQQEIGSLRRRQHSLANAEDVSALRENLGHMTKQLAEKDHQIELLKQKMQSAKKRGCF